MSGFAITDEDVDFEITDEGEIVDADFFCINAIGVADLLELRPRYPFDLPDLFSGLGKGNQGSSSPQSCLIEDFVDVLDLYVLSWAENPWRHEEHRYNSRNKLLEDIKECDLDDDDQIAAVCSLWILKRIWAACPWEKVLPNIFIGGVAFFNTEKTIAWARNRKTSPLETILVLVKGYLKKEAGIAKGQYADLADRAAGLGLLEATRNEDWEKFGYIAIELINHYLSNAREVEAEVVDVDDLSNAPLAPKEPGEKSKGTSIE